MIQTITNTQFDSAASAIPAPFGPLTRKSDIESISPNSQVAAEVTSALGYTFYISYQDLTDPVESMEIIRQAHGQLYVYQAMVDTLAVLLANANDTLSTVTQEEMYSFFRAMRNLTVLYGMIPLESTFEYNSKLKIRADFEAVDGEDGTATLTAEIQGDYSMFLWETIDDDGNPVTSTDEVFAFDPGAAGTYPVRLVVIGGGSVDPVVISKSVTITGGD